jgi:hypothetical protein
MKSNPSPNARISLDVDVPTDSEREEEYMKKHVSFRRRLQRWLWHVLARQFTLLCVIILRIAGWVGRPQRRLLPGEGCEIMLTGRLDSDNWILAHLGPLSASKECSHPVHGGEGAGNCPGSFWSFESCRSNTGSVFARCSRF